MSGCPSPQTSIEITTLEETIIEETTVITTEEEVKEETAIASTNEESNMGMLAYVKDGNIYIKVLPDGQVKQLTIDGKNHSPHFSPSGQWIAYYKNDKLCLIKISSDETREINTNNEVIEFIWSPVSDTIAYITQTGSLFVASSPEWYENELVPNIDGGEKTYVIAIAWSPDGGWIAYSQNKWIKKEPPPEIYSSLFKIRKDGSEEIELCGSNVLLDRTLPLPDAYYASIVAIWSLDGEYILFWSEFTAAALANGTSLMVIPANGGNPSEVVDRMLLYSDFLDNSPNGKSIAVTEGGDRLTWTNKHIVVVNITSGDRSIITDKNISALYPEWSTDGKQIAYVAAPDIGSNIVGGDIAKAEMINRSIWVVNVSNMEKLQFKQLTNDQAYRDEFPIWSKDGKYILFAQIDTEGIVSLWLIPEEGGEPQQVVEELTLTSGWFGFYGYTDWNDYFDWWQGDVITALK